MLPGRERDYLLDGGNWKTLRKALAWLSASQAERIVVFNAPIDSAWLARTDGPVAMAMEDRFSEMMARETARHPKVEYLDFFRNPLPELEDGLTDREPTAQDTAEILTLSEETINTNSHDD